MILSITECLKTVFKSTSFHLSLCLTLKFQAFANLRTLVATLSYHWGHFTRKFIQCEYPQASELYKIIFLLIKTLYLKVESSPIVFSVCFMTFIIIKLSRFLCPWANVSAHFLVFASLQPEYKLQERKLTSEFFFWQQDKTKYRWSHWRKGVILEMMHAIWYTLWWLYGKRLAKCMPQFQILHLMTASSYFKSFAFQIFKSINLVSTFKFLLLLRIFFFCGLSSWQQDLCRDDISSIGCTVEE